MRYANMCPSQVMTPVFFTVQTQATQTTDWMVRTICDQLHPTPSISGNSRKKVMVN
jgi:hypothetical protein